MQTLEYIIDPYQTSLQLPSSNIFTRVTINISPYPQAKEENTFIQKAMKIGLIPGIGGTEDISRNHNLLAY